jgi:outer membrane receptor protein involved in Fe transport
MFFQPTGRLAASGISAFALLTMLDLGCGARAFAQTVGADGDAEPMSGLTEIIVTARKREESLQDVPLSIATLDASQLQGRGLTSDYDIANFTVGFRTLQQTGRDTDRPTIRGMGAPVSRGEPNASYFIDGIFVSGSISTAVTGAVDRVEVLRGPQSAQFGRATFAGAVNYVTKKPTDTFKAEINGRSGTHDDHALSGWASGPILRKGRRATIPTGVCRRAGSSRIHRKWRTIPGWAPRRPPICWASWSGDRPMRPKSASSTASPRATTRTFRITWPLI